MLLLVLYDKYVLCLPDTSPDRALSPSQWSKYQRPCIKRKLILHTHCISEDEGSSFVCLKRRHPSTKLYSVISYKTVIFLFCRHIYPQSYHRQIYTSPFRTLCLEEDLATYFRNRYETSTKVGSTYFLENKLALRSLRDAFAFSLFYFTSCYSVRIRDYLFIFLFLNKSLYLD